MFLQYLKENPDCLYIYNRDFSIYGLPEKERYTIVVKDDWNCPEEFTDYDAEVYEIYRLSDWFDIVLKGDLIGWECACLNKKNVIKEHVKLMMTTNPLQLRKNVDSQYHALLVRSNIGSIKEYWELIKNIKFSIQIIENHKIVNFKETSDDYKILSEYTDLNQIVNFLDFVYSKLEELTDGVLEMEKRKRLRKHE